MYLQLDILEIRELGVSMGGCTQTCEVQIDNMVLKNLCKMWDWVIMKLFVSL